MRPWQAVVFDLDDTLFAEREYVLSGFRAVARWAETKLGVPEAAGYVELQRMFEAGVRGDTFNRWLGAMGQSLDLVPELLRAYRSHRPVLRPYPGVTELLTTLTRRCKLGLISDGYHEVQRAKFEALQLAPHFSAVVFSDTWGRSAWKPSVRPFHELLALLGMNGEEAVYVADNPLKDFLGARTAGMATIRTRYCGGDYAGLGAPSEEYEPDLTVETLGELQCYLLGRIP